MKTTIITITGPSCAGKSTLEKMLVERGIAVNAISTTTRPMRAGDVNGQSYYFHSKKVFATGLENGKFIEHVEFGGNYYGMSVPEIERVSALGKPIVIVCEPIGQKQIKTWCAANDVKLVSVFVTNPKRVIADRFMLRLWDELTANRKSAALPGTVLLPAASRLAEMMGTERGWVTEALVDGTYDLSFWRFDPNTQDWVIEKIVEKL